LSKDNIYISEPILLPPPGKDTSKGEASVPPTSEAIEIEVEGSDDDYQEEEEEEEEEGYKTPTPKKLKRKLTPKKTPTPTPRMAKKPPAKKVTMAIAELNKSTARLGLTEGELAFGQISIPILRGSWKKKIRKEDDDGGFVTSKKEFNLIRMLPYSGISLKQCKPLWLDAHHLRLTMVWPRWFKSVKRQIAFQTAGSAHQFDEDHDIIDSLQHDINSKSELKKDKKPRVADFGVFHFDLPQDISKAATEINILKVTILKDDLDADEELPPGSVVKVLQIITQQKMEGEEENLLDVTERAVKLGNYKLNCIVLYCIVLNCCIESYAGMHASHFYSFLYR
jgi:hypothetical protein